VGGILARAGDSLAATGPWPTRSSGGARAAPGEDRRAVDDALRHGWRQFPGGTSLARPLSEQRGKRNLVAPPRLAEGEIVPWAVAHHGGTGA
jgi:hypothetical protein